MGWLNKTLKVLLFLSLTIPCFHLHAKDDYLSLQSRLIDVFEQNKNAVVRVIASYEEQQSDEEESSGFLLVGTGFFISKEGHVMTNATVVNRPNRIWVDYDNNSYEAETVGFDSVTNLSIIKLKNLPDDFTFLHLAESTDSLPSVGTLLFSISCELGFDPSPSMGLLTGQNLHYGNQVLPTTYLRSDIPSDGGEGGAPVFDVHGRLIGMVVVSLPEIRSSFILPTRAARRIRDDILFSGRVLYGYLGIRINPTPLNGLNPFLEIEAVLPNSPAAEVGLLPNDILLKVGDFNVKNLPDLHNATFFSRPGQYLPIEILRDGDVKQFSLKIVEHPNPENTEAQLDAEQATGTLEVSATDTPKIENISPELLQSPLNATTVVR